VLPGTDLSALSILFFGRLFACGETPGALLQFRLRRRFPRRPLARAVFGRKASLKAKPSFFTVRNEAGLCPVPANWWPPANAGTNARGYPIGRTPVPNLLR